MNKAIFLDRDGTIIEDAVYLKRIEDIKVIPGAIEALQKFHELGFLNIIVTNQSGVARGYFTEEYLGEIHNKLKLLFGVKDSTLIDDIFYSPDHPDGILEKYKKISKDRKPDTGMITIAQKKHNIDMQNSYFIGDSYIDMKCADNAGIRSVFVLTGKKEEDLTRCKEENIKIEYIAKDILEASKFIEEIQRKK